MKTLYEIKNNKNAFGAIFYATSPAKRSMINSGAFSEKDFKKLDAEKAIQVDYYNYQFIYHYNKAIDGAVLKEYI